MGYKIGDKVLFYVDVAREDPVAGEIVDVTDTDFYKILYEGSVFGVRKQFITGRIVPDKEVIASLEERILNDDKKLQVLNKRIVEADAKIEELKKKIAEQKDEINKLERDKPWHGIFDDCDESRKRRKDPFPYYPHPRWRPLMCTLGSARFAYKEP